MGISGLLPFLKKASRPANVSEFSGKTAAIDVYVWLHKGAFGCAEKLVQNQPTDGYVTYVMKYLDMLLFFNVKPILVFDGRNLPSKSETERKRRENRVKYRKMALDYLREGKVREARDCFQRCIDITPAMARDVIEACRQRNIDCIVAPYEADSQLAFLNLNGIADFIISEDSDLAPFGCDKILFKMDISGNGTLFEKDKIHLTLGLRADNFTFEKFRYMCIMAGCDYHPSLPGIGLGKSCKFWGKVTNSDLRSVLQKIPSYLNMAALDVTDEYIRGFCQANDTFLYQLVFDPRTRKLRPLTDYPDDVDVSSANPYPFAGAYIEEELAYQMALGNVDLNTLTIVSHYDPDQEVVVNASFKPRYGRRTTHPSIWWQEQRFQKHQADKNRETEKAKEKATEIQKTFELVPARPWLSTKRKIEYVSSDEENVDDPDPVEADEEDDVIAMYKPKKSKLDESVQKYFKTVMMDASKSTPKPNIVYVSKYFLAKTENLVSKKVEEIDSDNDEKARAKEKDSKRQSGDWLSELESNVDNRNNIFTTSTKSDDSKENTRRNLTKLSTLPPLKNNPATRHPFKPVVISNLSQKGQSKEVRDPGEAVDEDKDRAKRRNPFAKKTNVEMKIVNQQSRSILSNETFSSADSGFYSQNPVEVSSSQLSICSIDDDKGEESSRHNLASPSPNRPDEMISPYFSAKKPPTTTTSPLATFSQGASKPRVPVSGLLKRKGGGSSGKRDFDAKQPSLLQMWGKKTP